jgi:two-component system, NarL family, nitrate/nitrite response regulator NarL
MGAAVQRCRGGEDPAGGEPATQLGGGSTAEPRRVLVVCGNLMSAETVTIALNQLTFTARFVVPVTIAHLEDVVSWHPAAALVDVESIDTDIAVRGTAVLRAAGVAVVAMGGSPGSPALSECLAAGAATIVTKDAPLTRLTEVMRSVTGGQGQSSEAEPGFAGTFEAGRPARSTQLAVFDVLTAREKFVLSELMDGHVAEVIAGRSSVAVSTVRSQIKSILQKLGVNSQLAAAALARNAGWTLQPPASVPLAPSGRG